jgi:hypothetical protein
MLLLFRYKRVRIIASRPSVRRGDDFLETRDRRGFHKSGVITD